MQLFKYHLGRSFHANRRKDLFLQIKINLSVAIRYNISGGNWALPGFEGWNTKNIPQVLLLQRHIRRIWSSHVMHGTERTLMKITITLNHTGARKIYCNLSESIIKTLNVPDGIKRVSFPWRLPQKQNTTRERDSKHFWSLYLCLLYTQLQQTGRLAGREGITGGISI